MDLKTLQDTPPWEWPEDTAETLLRILSDDRADESERLVAAELAGDFVVINDELVDALLSILRSPHESEQLRGKAAISFGPALEQAYVAEIDNFEEPDESPITEQVFHKLVEALGKLYLDGRVPKYVRRRILEAAVRAPRDWQWDAVREAYSGDDGDWKLTAVFCMRFLRGFDDQILESLDSKNPEIHYEAVCAAGNWEIDGAWSHVAGLITSERTEKPLLLAAIEALPFIRPGEATEILCDIESDDEDIAEAIKEAMMAAETFSDEDDPLLN